jgi:hypothetical protein
VELVGQGVEGLEPVEALFALGAADVVRREGANARRARLLEVGFERRFCRSVLDVSH